MQYATIGHPAAVAAPRRYVARRGDEVVILDGLPIDRLGQFPASDSEQLLDRWSDLPSRLEGLFSAVRIDLRRATVECLTDVLGMAHVYVHRSARRWVLGNNVAAVSTTAGLNSPHHVGAASMLTLGWPIAGSTLVHGVDQLPGGHVHTLGPNGVRSRAHFSAATVAPRRHAEPPSSTTEVAQAMVRTTAAAGHDVEPLVCGVTAGRDTRLLMALARAARLDARYYTSGEAGDVDVEFARDLTGRLGLPWELVSPEVPSGEEELIRLTARFVAQTDGLATLRGIDDWIDHQHPVERIGLTLSGSGGEIGRAGVGLAIPFAANVWGLRSALAPQRWILRRKAHKNALFRPAALEATHAALDRFAEERISEGWRPREVLESYYAFERVAHWAACGIRRASAATDLYSPFVTRDFINWCFSLSPEERFVEAPHWRLLSELAPDMRDMPFQYPWRAQRPQHAQSMVIRDIAGHATDALRARLRPRPTPTPKPRRIYGAQWLDAARVMHRELCLSQESSPLWELVDRRALEAALARPQDQQQWAPDYWLSVCHVLTTFWWFHGREAATPALVGS